MGRQRITWFASLLLLLSTSWSLGSCNGGRPQRPTAEEVAGLRQSATESLSISYNPATERPSFMRGRIPLAALASPADTSAEAVARSLIRRHARLFGVDSTGRSLQPARRWTDRLGMRHVVLQQMVDNVPVYNAVYAVHVDPRKGAVVAVSSSLVPDIRVNTTTPGIGEDSARALARALVRDGKAASSRLLVYPGRDRGSKARLAWVVEVFGQDTVRDTVRAQLDIVPARRDVVIDATKAVPLAIIDRLYSARNRAIYHGNGSTTLPGTLRRSEGQAAVGDPDVDSAYKFVGTTYDYYQSTHSRDSYDNAGATLIATAHYGVNVENAFWNGTQMIFGDGFAVEDVTAHELTHAVTERTANLEYRWQSGALNESFSDIFGAMVDRSDWEMGEDLPIGAIRNLENPAAHGLPAHTGGWLATCSDNEGVHTNSSIFSKAFVNVATAIGKSDAEKIFYRALTVPGYLTPTATMEDARGAAIQAAVDLFGTGSTQVNATTNGFNAVGLDGVWQPPNNSCLTIPSPADLSTIALAILALLLTILILRARARRAAKG